MKPAQGRFRYHNDPAKTADTWRDDAFSVGDIGHLDDEGWLYLTDRASDLIIRAGVNVYPREIEDVLYLHPAVVDCAVFGVPDERDGEHPVAVVELRPGQPTGPAELDQWCRQRLDPYKCPDTVRDWWRPCLAIPTARCSSACCATRPGPVPGGGSDHGHPDPPDTGLGDPGRRRALAARRLAAKWTTTGPSALLGGYSPTSGQYHFPLGPLCPYTGADDVEAVALSPHGTLFAWTAVTAPPPGYQGAVPFGFGIVELTGGEMGDASLRVIGRLTEAEPEALTFGQPMRVVVETLPGERSMWAFAPIHDGPSTMRRAGHT